MDKKIITYGVAAVLVALAGWLYVSNDPSRSDTSAAALDGLFADGDVVLPIAWNDNGVQLQQLGVLDRQKFDSIYAARGGMSASAKSMLDETTAKPIVMTKENSAELLNIFWAFGLANKNPILEQGPMVDPRYKGSGPPAGGFASTGGWSLAAPSAGSEQVNPMDHYSKYSLVVLTSKQQELVERVSKNVYRPCCDNSTYFPDCNHGMAMLGLLELMAAQNVGEQEMYSVALKVQGKWFPDTYASIREYLKVKRVPAADITPQILLGAQYSSASGYRAIAAMLKPTGTGGGSSCGV